MTSKPIVGARLRQSHPLARGLVAFYLFNEKMGTKVNDYSPSAKTGDLLNFLLGTSVVSNWIGSIFGGGLIFDGTTGTGYINCGKSSGLAGLGSQELTIVAWVKVGLSTSTSSKYIIGDFNSGITTNNVGLNRSGSSPYKFQFFHAGGTALIISPNTPTVGRWYQVVGVRSGYLGNWTLRLYENGDEVVSGTTAINPNATQEDLAIGTLGNVAGNFKWNGIIDHIRLYNRALSPTEIKNLYSDPFQDFSTPFKWLYTSPTTSIKKVDNVSQSIIKKIANVAMANIKKLINIQ